MILAFLFQFSGKGSGKITFEFPLVQKMIILVCMFDFHFVLMYHTCFSQIFFCRVEIGKSLSECNSKCTWKQMGLFMGNCKLRCSPQPLYKTGVGGKSTQMSV